MLQWDRVPGQTTHIKPRAIKLQKGVQPHECSSIWLLVQPQWEEQFNLMQLEREGKFCWQMGAQKSLGWVLGWIGMPILHGRRMSLRCRHGCCGSSPSWCTLFRRVSGLQPAWISFSHDHLHGCCSPQPLQFSQQQWFFETVWFEASKLWKMKERKGKFSSISAELEWRLLKNVTFRTSLRREIFCKRLPSSPIQPDTSGVES